MSIFTQSLKRLFPLGLMPCFLAACMVSIPTQGIQPPPEPIMLTAETHQTPFSLPAPLFYLQDGQIWRLSPDAHTKQQITSENTPVDAFDISPSDGRLAYISNNNLVITDPNNGHREALLIRPGTTPVSDDLTHLTGSPNTTSTRRTPLWSPDGQRIAYIENGLHVYDLEHNHTEQLWNNSNPSNDQIILDSLLSWSPDGQFFLVSQSTHPIESLNQRKLALIKSGAFLLDLGENAMPTFTWNPDVTALYIANASSGDPSSLLRCDLPGFVCTMIAEFEPARWYYHYAYPFISAEDNLMVFMGSTDDPDLYPETFKMITLNIDGSERRNLRSDGYRLITALWSPDGAGVLIVLAQDANDHQAGSMIWLNIGDHPPIALPVKDAHHLRWDLSYQE